MIRLTKKEVTESTALVISVGYCDAHHLLRWCDTPFYTAGAYGSNDVYFFKGGRVALATGYHPFGIPPAPEVLARYENAAKNAGSREEVEALLQVFINEEWARHLNAVFNKEV